MAKVTEKSLRERASQLNLNELKLTLFGVKVDRNSKGYFVQLVYRDATPPETMIEEASASEADACLSAVARTSAVFKAVQGTIKPAFTPTEVFIKQGGERCPKCATRDINPGHIKRTGDLLEQYHTCSRCETIWHNRYKLEGYEVQASGTGND